MNEVGLTSLARSAYEFNQPPLVKNFEFLQDLHAKNSCNAIRQACTGLKGTMLILGLGQGEDIPLKDIYEIFDKIIIIDLDEKSVEKCLQKLTSTHKNKIEFRAVDLTGIVGPLSQACEKRLINKKSLINELPNVLKNAIKGRSSEFRLPKTDIVISSIVMTQLQGHIKNYLKSLFGSEHTTDIDSSLNECLVEMQSNYIQDLWRCADKVYFADTVSATYINHSSNFKVGSTGPMVHPDILPLMKMLFTAEKDIEGKEMKWSWSYFFKQFNNHSSIIKLVEAQFLSRCMPPLENKIPK